MTSTKPTGTIEALHLVALLIDANNKEGTPEHSEAVRLHEEAKKLWLKKFEQCPHCGRRGL